MPARKTPLGFKDKHYNAEQVMNMFSVSQAKAYEIIHQCVAYGSVLKIGGSLRVSETALSKWYDTHNLQNEVADDPLQKAIHAFEDAKKAHARRGRPPKGGVMYAE